MEHIPSPFSKLLERDDKMLRELDTVYRKYGYTHFAWVGGKDRGKENSEWTGASNTISDGMIDYLRHTIDYMQNILDKKGTDEQ